MNNHSLYLVYSAFGSGFIDSSAPSSSKRENKMQINQMQRTEYLKLIKEIGYLDLISLDSCAERLNEIGVKSHKTLEPIGISIEGIQIKAYKTIDDGDGIYAIDLLLTAIKSENMGLTTRMNGRGFRFQDLLDKVANIWSVDVSSL